MTASTVKVRFEDGITRDVEVTTWIYAEDNVFGRRGGYMEPNRPDWYSILPNHEVYEVVGVEFHAYRR